MPSIAFFTVALLRSPVYEPEIASLGEMLDPVWDVAESGSGFLALSKQEEISGERNWGALTAPPLFQKAEAEMRLLRTLSLWEDIESVFAFSYNGMHKKVFSRRKEWFTSTESPSHVIWWVADDHTPTWKEACERYEKLLQVGPSAAAFTFKHPYDKNGLPAKLDREAIDRKAAHYGDEI